MGQAKRRGSFEERQKLAIERDEELRRIAADNRRRERAAEDDRIDAMSDEERDAYYTRRSRRAWRSGVLAASLLLLGTYY